MELLTNLLPYLPGPSGFASHVRRVLPGLPGHRLLVDGAAGVVCRRGDLLPRGRSPSPRLALLQRLGLVQHGVNVGAALGRAGLGRGDLAAVFSPYGERLLALPEVPQVITCHDLTPLHVPNGRKDAWRARHWLPRHLRGAARVVAISRFVADQLLAVGVPAERIRVVPNGIPPGPGARPAPGGGDLLLLARHDRNKNVEHALRGFARLLTLRPAWQGRLRVVGRGGRRSAAVRKAVGELGLKGRVELIEAVPEPTLAALLASSLALVSCSRMEGCNYPVLEAMAAGLPTLISAIPVHRELYGGAALLFPLDDDGTGLAAAALRLTAEPSLWRELSERGARRAAAFPLEAQRAGLRAVIAEVARG